MDLHVSPGIAGSASHGGRPRAAAIGRAARPSPPRIGNHPLYSAAVQLLGQHPAAARCFLLGIARDAGDAATPDTFATALAEAGPAIERADALLGTLGGHGHAVLERHVLHRPAGQTTATAFARFCAPRTLRNLHRSLCRRDARQSETSQPPGLRIDAATAIARGSLAPAPRLLDLRCLGDTMTACLLLAPLAGSTLAHHVHAPMQLGGTLRPMPSLTTPAPPLLDQCRALEPSGHGISSLEAATVSISDWDGVASVPVEQLDAFASCLRRIQRELRAMGSRLASRRRELVDRPGTQPDQITVQVALLASLIERTRDMSTRILDARLHVNARIGNPPD